MTKTKSSSQELTIIDLMQHGLNNKISNLQKIFDLIKKEPSQLLARDKNGDNALGFAAKNNLTTEIELFINFSKEHGLLADLLSNINEFGNNAICQAIISKHESAALKIVTLNEFDRDITSKEWLKTANNFGKDAIELGIESDFVDLIEQITSIHRMSQDELMQYSATAVAIGNEELMEIFDFQKDQNNFVNFISQACIYFLNNQTQLAEESLQIAQGLINQGVDINFVDASDHSALDIALESESIEVFHFLASNYVNCVGYQNYFEDPQNPKQLYLNKQITSYFNSLINEVSLICASRSILSDSKLSHLSKLIELIPLNESNKGKFLNSYLSICSESCDDLKKARLFLDHGANPLAINSSNRTSLDHAFNNGFKLVFNELLEQSFLAVKKIGSSYEQSFVEYYSRKALQNIELFSPENLRRIAATSQNQGLKEILKILGNKYEISLTEYANNTSNDFVPVEVLEKKSIIETVFDHKGSSFTKAEKPSLLENEQISETHTSGDASPTSSISSGITSTASAENILNVSTSSAFIKK